MSMYLKLNEVVNHFDRLYGMSVTYFNKEDYQIYCEEERLELIDLEVFDESDFLLIPQIDYKELKARFLIKQNNKRLLRMQNDKDFDRKFHWYTEDNSLVGDWVDFVDTELISFAAKWCEQNQIKFTLK